jgi:hypothetical protein
MSGFEKHTALPIATPSPLVGEGITAARRKLGWVRGIVSGLALLKQPLTRPDAHCVRVAPPSPTRGEGKSPPTQHCQTV